MKDTKKRIAGIFPAGADQDRNVRRKKRVARSRTTLFRNSIY